MEFIKAIRAIAIRASKALSDDGKISLIESAGFLLEISKVIEAFNGISDIPNELLNMSDDDFHSLRSSVYTALSEFGTPHEVSVRSDAVIMWLKQTLDAVKIIKYPPPSAIEVK